MFTVEVNGWQTGQFETKEFAMIFVDAAIENGASEIRIEVKP